MTPAGKLISALATYILNPVIGVMIAVALLYFIWGVVQYVRNADDSAARETGSRHIIYGIIGLFIMISAFSIVKVILNSFNLTEGVNYVDGVKK